jgi:hypothetical protein
MDERRQFQRLRLIKPILATARGENVLLLDVGVAGALIEHRGAAKPGDTFTLSFLSQGTEIAYVCEVAHTEAHGLVSHSGLRFLEPVGDSAARLRELMASFVDKVITAQKANASGGFRAANTKTFLEQLGQAHRERARGFARHRLVNGTWTQETTESPVQPIDGFTIASFEDDDDVAKLRRTYERSDQEGRDLIRVLAELSLAK